MGIENYKKFFEELLISIIVPTLHFVRINKDGLEEFSDDSDPPNRFVFVEDKVYLVSEPLLPLERLRYIDIENGKEYQFIENEMRLVLEAGITGALARILLRAHSAAARLRTITQAKHIFKWNKKEKKYELVAGVGLGTLIAFGLKQSGDTAKSVAAVALTLIQTKLFLNFIAEEAIAAASMSCYIASGRDPEVLEKAIEVFETTTNICDDIIMFADNIPIMHELQVPFVAFLNASKGALDTYKHVLWIAKKRTAMERAGKKAAVVYIYTDVPAKIHVDGIYIGRYTPASVRVRAGTRKITLTRRNYYTYETTITVKEFEIAHLGSAENPITLTPKEKIKVKKE